MNIPFYLHDPVSVFQHVFFQLWEWVSRKACFASPFTVILPHLHQLWRSPCCIEAGNTCVGSSALKNLLRASAIYEQTVAFSVTLTAMILQLVCMVVHALDASFLNCPSQVWSISYIMRKHMYGKRVEVFIYGISNLIIYIFCFVLFCWCLSVTLAEKHQMIIRRKKK